MGCTHDGLSKGMDYSEGADLVMSNLQKISFQYVCTLFVHSCKRGGLVSVVVHTLPGGSP